MSLLKMPDDAGTRSVTNPTRPMRVAPAALWLALAGGVGGFIGHDLAGSILHSSFDFSLASKESWSRMLLGQALLAMIGGAGIGVALLIVDNLTSLRGRWHRDLLRGTFAFLGLAFIGGLLGQLTLSLVGITRGLSWAITGLFIGLGMGFIRSDPIQRKHGALGGVIGGFLSGLMVDGFLAVSYTDEAFARASLYGVILTGALIGFFVRWVQDALQTAWLVGVTTGPYEGKRYPLNTSRVTVGKDETCDISLYRESELRLQSGFFDNSSGQWFWGGEPVLINGVAQSDVALSPGDTLRLGATDFRFQTRGVQQTDTDSLLPDASVPALPSGNNLAVGTIETKSSQHWLLIGSQCEFSMPRSDGERAVEKTLGRTDDNDFVLPDSGISSHHALLRAKASQLFITDLNSTNGTRVNGVMIAPQTETAIDENSTVTMGQSNLVVSRQ